MSSETVAILEAREYCSVTTFLYEEAVQSLDKYGISHARVTVPNIIDLPIALCMLIKATDEDVKKLKKLSGYIIFGCFTKDQELNGTYQEILHSVQKMSCRYCVTIGYGLFPYKENETDKQLTEKAQNVIKSYLHLINFRKKLKLIA
ncbi:MAG: 6,7-dimethyl-8-ribityllumazine synthase [Alphaproteobacteria bacterium]